MNGAPSTSTRVTAGLAIVAGLVALAWQGMPDAPSAAPAPARVAVAVAEPASVAASGAIEPPGPPSLDAFASLYAAAASAMPAASTPLAADEIEVCGVGRVKSKDGQPLDRTLFTSSAEQARKRLIATLAQHPDELARAAGLLLQRDDGPAQANAPQPCDGGNCAPAGEASEADHQRTPRLLANAAQRDALAQMAVTTRSAAVYTLAWRSCQASPGGSCQLLSTRQLTVLDPNNADAWLEVAAEADQRGEAGIVDEALYRASKAGTADLRRGQLAALALRNLAPGTPAVERRALLERVMAVESALSLPGTKTLVQHCDANAVRDANRQQVCSDLAELMARRSTSLLDMTLGQALGERAGWPAERVQVLRQERDALAQAMKPLAAAPGTEWACPQIERSGRWALEVGQFGEVGAARMLIARSGQNIAALAKQYQDDRAAAARAASSPASGTVALR